MLEQAVQRHRAGNLPQAIASYRRVLAERPHDPDALHMLGVALAQIGRAAEAVPLIRLALQSYPDQGMVHFNLGNAFAAMGRHAEALIAYQRAAELAADRPEAHAAACRMALEIEQFAGALESADRALALRPGDGYTLLHKASALIALDRPAEALDCCDRAVGVIPEHWGAQLRRGVALARLGRLTEAEPCFVRAVQLNPGDPSVHTDLGNLYGAQGRSEPAVASFARALELKPDFADARWNLALLRLARGEFAEGWALYEERFTMDARRGSPMRVRERRWTGGERLEGKRILLWSERGLGDTLQFCRYAPLLRDLGADVTLEVQARLKALLEGQFPGVQVIGRGEPVPAFDYQCPLLSVPGALHTELASIPAAVPYLKVNPAAVERWSHRFPGGPALRVGIAWQGNADAERNWARGRSWPLGALEPLARLAGVTLVSLQTGPGIGQLSSVSFADRVVSFGEELDAGPDAFLDTAAILESLDLVISCDTSIAHLAGALGVPVWVALHLTSEWRWLLNREDSPWYPTMRLFRQRAAGDWDAVVAEMCRALDSFSPSKAQPRERPEPLKGPDDVEALCKRGAGLQALGRVEEAVESFSRALALRPGLAEAHHCRGNALYELGRFELALEDFERAASARPDHADTHNSLGATLFTLGRFEDAERSLQHALRLDPGHAGAHYNRGLALQQLRRPEEALRHVERALQLRPDNAEACQARANLLLELGQPSAALDGYDRAVALHPRAPGGHIGRGNALLRLGRIEQALESYDHALRIKPDNGEFHYYRANALRRSFRYRDALESYAAAYRLLPEQPWLLGIWLHARLQMCAWDGLEEHAAELVSRIERGLRATPPFSLLGLVDSATLQRRAAQIWVEAQHTRAPPLPALPRRPRAGRIRVGYFSADFHEHATAFLAAQLFERHDRGRFELIAFSFGPDSNDDMRARLRAAFDSFLDVQARSDREITLLSRELAIDIAVDLKGHTQQGRSGIFAHRAAPIQVSYLGYPGTTGAPYMDYLIADRTLIPAESRPAYSERIVYLPDSYQPNDRHRKIADIELPRAALDLPDHAFVFCSFNGAYKLAPRIFDIWVRILKAVPGSVLWLLAAEETVSGNLKREAAARGLDVRRLIFAPPLPLPAHLARLRAADLFLDTLPCNAHTTASDALWAGLPVLTLIGESFAARVGASLLGAVGLPELIARSAGEYEALAIELARRPERLAGLRERLRANRLTAPLFDIDAYTGHLESAYVEMYDRHHSGLPPADIHI